MFSVTKKVVAEFDKLYAIAGLTDKGHFTTCYAASEGREGRCVEVDLISGIETEIWSSVGGTMTLCPTGEKDEVLATQKFWPVFDAEESVIVRIHKEGKGYVTEQIQKIPYLHRFEFLDLSWGRVLVVATLCGQKSHKDDWSQPGAVYAGIVEKGRAEPVILEPVLKDITRNHGFCVTTVQGETAVLIGAAEGVFALYPPEKRGGGWESKKLLERETSDVACFDLDDDGQDELVIIEGFHGNQVTVNKWINGGFQPVWNTNVAFGHALWCGKIAEKRCLITGYRRGEMELSLFDFTDCFKNPNHLLIGNGGPSQICVSPNEKGAEIISADREKGQAVLYLLVDND